VVGSDAAGNFVVLWHSYGQGGSDIGVFGQRYDALGRPAGAEFAVAREGASPDVAVETQGDFVVTWTGTYGYGAEVFGQRYDEGGEPEGGEFVANTLTYFWQFQPSVAVDDSGNFVVVWQGDLQDGSEFGIFGQRFAGRGIFIDGFESGDTSAWDQTEP
jgi:hypothetical protein